MSGAHASNSSNRLSANEREGFARRWAWKLNRIDGSHQPACHLAFGAPYWNRLARMRVSCAACKCTIRWNLLRIEYGKLTTKSLPILVGWTTALV